MNAYLDAQFRCYGRKAPYDRPLAATYLPFLGLHKAEYKHPEIIQPQTPHVDRTTPVCHPLRKTNKPVPNPQSLSHHGPRRHQKVQKHTLFITTVRPLPHRTNPKPSNRLTTPQTLYPQRQKRSEDHRAEEESVGEAEEDNESVLSSAIFDKGIDC